MAPRRSSRLRSATPLKPSAYAPAQIKSLTKCHEILSTETKIINENISLAPKTPVTAGRIQPAPEEMHPSKVHQSTTQEPDSGLRLGFTDIKSEGNNQSSGITQRTPSKINVVRSSFDFRFAHPGIQLGPEAQRMMDELHEEALRIKVKLAAEREEKNRVASDNGHVNIQKYTNSTHKAGRFSNAHRAEFRRMDSIAGHPSTFRVQSSRTCTEKKNLKRSPSKAQLDNVGFIDETDSVLSKSNETRYENERRQVNLPMKRARKHLTDDISSASRNRPTSKPNLSYSRSKLPPVVSIHTQASLARKSAKKVTSRDLNSMKSPGRANLMNNQEIKSSFKVTGNQSKFNSSHAYGLCSPNKFEHIEFSKSKPKTATDSLDQVNLTSSKKTCELKKLLSSIPTTPIGIKSSRDEKYVNFTPRNPRHELDTQNSPSPLKSVITNPISKSNFDVNSKSDKTQDCSFKTYDVNLSLESDSKSLDTTHKVEYPTLPKTESTKCIISKDRPLTVDTGAFIFRSDQTIKFGNAPNRSQSQSNENESSQDHNHSNYDFMIGSFPTNDKENEVQIPSLPHGMHSKRRKRPNSDDEEQDICSSPKKLKKQNTKSTIPRYKVLQNNLRRIPSPQKKSGVLSLSRLNILSCPKLRH